jgi:hypothetical protein
MDAAGNDTAADSIAVVFHFVQPVISLRRLLDELCELGLVKRNGQGRVNTVGELVVSAAL